MLVLVLIFSFLNFEVQCVECWGTPDTDAGVCSGNGECTSEDTCYCDENWEGDHCQNPVCYGVSADLAHVCNDHGACLGVDSCHCEDDWGGDVCDEAKCGGIIQSSDEVCNGKGTCKATTFTCECDSGWGGDECTIPECFGKLATHEEVCEAHGTCVDADTCECEENYSGMFCSVPMCYGFPQGSDEVCNGVGICSNDFKCSCDSAEWTGEDCTIPMCYGIPITRTHGKLACSGHGNCVKVWLPEATDYPLHEHQCECRKGWSGQECQDEDAAFIDWKRINGSGVAFLVVIIILLLVQVVFVSVGVIYFIKKRRGGDAPVSDKLDFGVQRTQRANVVKEDVEVVITEDD